MYHYIYFTSGRDTPQKITYLNSSVIISSIIEKYNIIEERICFSDSELFSARVTMVYMYYQVPCVAG